MEMLTHGLGRQPYPELLLQGLGQLLGVPGALLGEFAAHEVPHLTANARRVAWGAPVGQTLQAPPRPAVEVPSYARRRAAGVRGDLLHVRAPIGETQDLGAQTHFGLEVRILLDLSEPVVFLLRQSDVS